MRREGRGGGKVGNEEGGRRGRRRWEVGKGEEVGRKQRAEKNVRRDGRWRIGEINCRNVQA